VWNQGSFSGRGEEFSLLQDPGHTQPPIQQILRAWSPGLKQLRYETNHSPPPNIEIRNMWRHNSIPPNILNVRCLNKQTENFYTTPTTLDSRHTCARYLFVPELLNIHVVLLVRNTCLHLKIQGVS